MKQWILLASLMGSLVCRGQAGLRGNVSGEGTGLPGATVVIDKRFTTQTDSSGAFRFAALPAGRLSVHVSMTGFEAWQGTVAVQDTGLSTLSVELSPAVSSLDAVVVSGTMKAVRRLESPIPVEVYTQQFFRKNPTPSVFEGLALVNGVRPQINCNVCNTGDIHINGLEGPYTMVTIDGMPIVSSLSTVYGLFGIPQQLIERVEVVKGPASGLYGSEAIGGLINIITKSPDKAPVVSADLMTTSWREHLVDLGLKWKVGSKASSLLGINYFNYNHPVDNNGDNFTDVTLQHRISVFNKWQWQRRFNRRASLAGRYFYENRWGGEMQWNNRFRGGNEVYGESIYTRRWELLGHYQLPFRERINLDLSATGHHQDSYYGNLFYLGNQKIVFGQATWDKTLANHSLLVGLASRYTYYDDNSTATVDTLSKTNRPQKVWLPGLFVQEEWKLGAHRVLLGLRVDHHPIHRHIFTPRFAYKWSMDENQSLRLNAGTGFRVVNLFTEEHAALTGARAVEIAGNLEPERSLNANLNYQRKLGSRSRAAVLELTAFYTHFQNRLLPDYDTDPNKIIYANLDGHAVSRGVSASLEFRWWERLRGTVGATVQEVAAYQRNRLGSLEKIRPVLTENWSGTWTLSYSFPLAGLTLDYTGTVYGPMRLPVLSALDPRRSESPVWSLQNFQLTKWFSKKMEVYGGVKNLLNWTPDRNNPFLIARANDPFDKNVQFDNSGNVLATPDNPYALTFDPTYVFAPNQGRRIFLGVRLTLR